MSTGTFRVPPPVNEPVRAYAPGSAERASLQKQLVLQLAFIKMGSRFQELTNKESVSKLLQTLLTMETQLSISMKT